MIMIDGEGRRITTDRTETVLPRDHPLDVPLTDAIALRQAIVASAPAFTSRSPRPRFRPDLLDQPALEIVDRAPHDPRIVLELAQTSVATEAQQTSDVARGMIVIDVQRASVQTDATDTALLLDGTLDLGLGHAVTAFEVVTAHAAVLLCLDRCHDLVVARLAVSGPP
ncbi:hypothetical protein QWU11_21730 [Actinomadura sp. DC4]|nr:hypothetical protein [Actinomadura sp. DC4]MDN3355222.1 hypothetical protein [Actinomadura sp. DC4]